MQEVAYFRKKEKKVLKADWLITSAYAGYLFIWKPQDLPVWLQVLFLFLKILSLLFHPSRSYPMKHGIKLINEMEELKRSEEKLMNDVTKNCQNVFKQTLFWVFYYLVNIDRCWSLPLRSIGFKKNYPFVESSFLHYRHLRVIYTTEHWPNFSKTNR